MEHPKCGQKYEIYTPNQDHKHSHPFHMGVSKTVMKNIWPVVIELSFLTFLARITFLNNSFSNLEVKEQTSWKMTYLSIYSFPFSHDIMNPILPFALRLSSNLLIGVVRIYREQTKTVWGKE